MNYYTHRNGDMLRVKNLRFKPFNKMLVNMYAIYSVIQIS